MKPSLMASALFAFAACASAQSLPIGLPTGALPAMAGLPALPALPTLPAMPAFAALPTVPGVPVLPTGNFAVAASTFVAGNRKYPGGTATAMQFFLDGEVTQGFRAGRNGFSGFAVISTQGTPAAPLGTMAQDGFNMTYDTLLPLYIAMDGPARQLAGPAEPVTTPLSDGIQLFKTTFVSSLQQSPTLPIDNFAPAASTFVAGSRKYPGGNATALQFFLDGEVTQGFRAGRNGFSGFAVISTRGTPAAPLGTMAQDGLNMTYDTLLPLYIAMDGPARQLAGPAEPVTTPVSDGIQVFKTTFVSSLQQSPTLPGL